MTSSRMSAESIQQTKLVLNEVRRITTKAWNIMEICGGQTHAIMEFGLDQLLPEQITLIHGPGCPVCVTSLESIERALSIARQPGVIFTSFGDMLRVPGANNDLFGARANGADVRVVYSPMDAVKLAQSNPEKRWFSLQLVLKLLSHQLPPAFCTRKRIRSAIFQFCRLMFLCLQPCRLF